MKRYDLQVCTLSHFEINPYCERKSFVLNNLREKSFPSKEEDEEEEEEEDKFN